MKPLLHLLFAAGLALAGPAAHAALACSIFASPSTISGTYTGTSNLDGQGTFIVYCTRNSNDSRNHTLWIGMPQASNETLSKPAPNADTLTHGIYRNSSRSARWTSGSANSGNGSGALSLPVSFSGSNTALVTSATVYWRVPSGQANKAAGTYTDTFAVTVRRNNQNGTVLGTTTLNTQATVDGNCSMGSGQIGYSVAYQAFRNTPLIDTTKTVTVSCTRGTNYTLALDAGVGVVPNVQLTYTLRFTSNGGTSVSGTAASTTGIPHGLTLTLPGGQAGRCNTGTCQGNSVRTLTMTY